MRRFIVISLVVFLTGGFLTAETRQKTTRGHKWIQSHEFQIMAVVEGPNQIDNYKQFGFTSLMVTNLSRDGYPKKLAGFAVENKLPWQWFYRWTPNDGKRFVDELKKYKAQFPGLCGISVGDEVDDKYFENLGELIRQARKVVPDVLLYHALLGLDAADYASNLDSYCKYIQEAANLMDVDVLMYDQYPFRRSWTAVTFFRNLGVFREQALLAGKPYWNWLQAFGWEDGPFDEPCESQVALQAYASLAYGYKGLSYWTYSSNYRPYSRSLVDSNGKITPTGEIVRKLIPNIRKIGNILKGLKSIGIYYVDSKVNVNGQMAPHVPEGVERLERSSIPLVLSARVSDCHYGFLIGMFEDEEGNFYMMLVNANHGYKRTSDQTASAISVQFKENVDSITVFDCKSGEFRPNPLYQNKLNHVVLGGGTGRLYRIVCKK